MKIYKNQNEVEKDIKDNVLVVEGDVKFESSISIKASIVVNAGDINAWDITARDILYCASCCVYQSIKCFSIRAKKEKYQRPICLKGKLEIKNS